MLNPFSGDSTFNPSPGSGVNLLSDKLSDSPLTIVDNSKKINSKKKKREISNNKSSFHQQNISFGSPGSSFIILPDSSTISIVEESSNISVPQFPPHQGQIRIQNSFVPTRNEGNIVVPDLEITAQTCAREEILPFSLSDDSSFSSNSELSSFGPILVVVKDRAFEIRIGMKNYLAENYRENYWFDLHQLTFQIELIYDHDPQKLVADSQEPNPIDTQIKVGTDGTIATIEVRVHVLSSKKQEKLFRLRIIPVHPVSLQPLPERTIWSHPFRVISKPDQACTAHKKQFCSVQPIPPPYPIHLLPNSDNPTSTTTTRRLTNSNENNFFIPPSSPLTNLTISENTIPLITISPSPSPMRSRSNSNSSSSRSRSPSPSLVPRPSRSRSPSPSRSRSRSPSPSPSLFPHLETTISKSKAPKRSYEQFLALHLQKIENTCAQQERLLTQVIKGKNLLSDLTFEQSFYLFFGLYSQLDSRERALKIRRLCEDIKLKDAKSLFHMTREFKNAVDSFQQENPFFSPEFATSDQPDFSAFSQMNVYFPPTENTGYSDLYSSSSSQDIFSYDEDAITPLVDFSNDTPFSSNQPDSRSSSPSSSFSFSQEQPCFYSTASASASNQEKKEEKDRMNGFGNFQSIEDFMLDNSNSQFF